jgi:CRP-like cAMP-binding protein
LTLSVYFFGVNSEKEEKMSPFLRKRCAGKRARVSYLIIHEMRMRGFTGKFLAEKIGISDAAVSRTIHGLRHSPRVLDALREIGVPEKYIFDPRRREEA